MNRPISQRILQESFSFVESEDPVSFFSETGDAVHALTYAWLFWPELVEIHGAVFLALNGNDRQVISDHLKMPAADGHPEWPQLSWAQ